MLTDAWRPDNPDATIAQLGVTDRTITLGLQMLH